MLSNEWKLPLNLAIVLHVLVFVGAIYLPGLFKANPRFADIYTVSIINIAEPTVAPPSVAKPQQAKVPKVSPPQSKTKKVAPIAETPKKNIPVEKPAPVAQKAVSLKPLKKKIEKLPQPHEDTARKQQLEKIKRQKLAEAIREEEILAEKARLAREALEAERNLLSSRQLAETSEPTTPAVSGDRTSSTSTAAGSSTNLLESQYLASIFNRLHQFWAPPEYLQQDPNLTAVVVITINLDGTIANTLFESRSGDRVFDQFVTKTLEEANPMPPIPPALKKQRFEIGLRFKPGSIQ